jgi:hypothetical protein
MATQLPIRLEKNPIIDLYKRDVDVSLIRQNLQLTPQERLEKLIQLQQFAAELQRAGQTGRP